MEKLSISDLNIVLVEPSDTQRKIISGMLTKENVKQIDTAANIAEARKLVELHGADLIVSAMYFEDGMALDLLKFTKALFVCSTPATGTGQGLFSSTWFSTRCQNLVGRCQNSLSDDVTVSELDRTVSELGRTVSELGRTVSELESKL